MHLAVTCFPQSYSEKDFMRTLHCEGGQGYLFAKPMAADDAAAWLRDAQRGRADGDEGAAARSADAALAGMLTH